jgi:hypothetical protein
METGKKFIEGVLYLRCHELGYVGAIAANKIKRCDPRGVKIHKSKRNRKDKFDGSI